MRLLIKLFTTLVFDVVCFCCCCVGVHDANIMMLSSPLLVVLDNSIYYSTGIVLNNSNYTLLTLESSTATVIYYHLHTALNHSFSKPWECAIDGHRRSSWTEPRQLMGHRKGIRRQSLVIFTDTRRGDKFRLRENEAQSSRKTDKIRLSGIFKIPVMLPCPGRAAGLARSA